MNNRVNQKTGSYSREGFRAIIAGAREEKTRGNQSAVDQARRNIIQMGTAAQQRRIPAWMR